MTLISINVDAAFFQATTLIYKKSLENPFSEHILGLSAFLLNLFKKRSFYINGHYEITADLN